MKHLIIILGGNNSNNKDWAEKLVNGFNQHGESHLQLYDHWKNGGNDIDFEIELARLTDLLANYDGKYSIVCKSAGALLALQGINRGNLLPARLVCIGLPLEYADYKGLQLDKLVSTNKIPTLYIQAVDDPAGSASVVSEIVTHHGVFKAVPGSDHNYTDVSQIIMLASNFILTE